MNTLPCEEETGKVRVYSAQIGYDKQKDKLYILYINYMKSMDM